MASNYILDGSIIPRSVRRSADHRLEERFTPESQTAVLRIRGRNHVVRMVNLSSSGAMVNFSGVPHIGEELTLQLMGRQVGGQVRWVRDGRIGVSFTDLLE